MLTTHSRPRRTLHKRSSSSPLNQRPTADSSTPRDPPSPHTASPDSKIPTQTAPKRRSKLTKRNSGSNQTITMDQLSVATGSTGISNLLMEANGTSELSRRPPYHGPPTEQSSPHQERAPHIPRSSSYSRRHASCDSPREVPLPSPSLQQTGAVAQFGYFSTTASHAKPTPASRSQEVVESHSKASQPLAYHTSKGSNFRNDESFPVLEEHGTDVSSDRTSSSSVASTSSPPPSPIKFVDRRNSPQGGPYCAQAAPTHDMYSTITSNAPPDPRPLVSHPGNFSRSVSQNEPGSSGTDTLIFPFSRPHSVPDAESQSFAAALPFVLSSNNPSRISNWPDRNSSASLPLPLQIPFHALPQSTGARMMSPVDQGKDTTAGTAEFRGINPLASHVTTSVMEQTSNNASAALHALTLGSRSPSVGVTTSGANGSRPVTRPSLISSSSEESTSSVDSSSSSSFGPSSLLSASASSDSCLGSSSPMSGAGVAADANAGAGCVSLSSASSSSPSTPYNSYPRPLFRAPVPPSPLVQQYPQMPHSPRPSTAPGALPMASASAYPPPDPPIILPADTEDAPRSSGRRSAPYEPFLSHAPPPADSWIEVETTQQEYKLNVRLPGFKRDAITLATKKRRILHVVADSWENGGGHFERRISFGYDADLVQVRAEFDGEMLKIIIPRRLPPMNIWYPPRPTPVGRSS